MCRNCARKRESKEGRVNSPEYRKKRRRALKRKRIKRIMERARKEQNIASCVVQEHNERRDWRVAFVKEITGSNFVKSIEKITQF